MHIRVHGHGRADRPSGLKRPDRDGYVVEHAKPFAMPGIRVMETAAEVCGESIVKSPTPRQDRSSRRQAKSLHCYLRDGNLKLHPLTQREGIGLQLLEPRRCVHAQHMLVW